MTNRETSKTVTSKLTARRLYRRLRDHGLLCRIDTSGRGDYTLTVLVPEKFEIPAIDRLCNKILNETQKGG